MKTNACNSLKYILLFLACLAGSFSSRAQVATWGNGGGNSEWNTAANWDIGVPAEGTNAVIPAGQTVNYNLPMVATTFGSLACSGILNVNTNGFVAASAFDQVAASQILFNNGAIATFNGNCALFLGATLGISPGAILNVTGNLIAGSGTTGGTGNNSANSFGTITNYGGTINATNTSLNPANGSIATAARLLILGGTNNLGNLLSGRQPGGASATPKYGADGLTISNGFVTTTSITLGNNAHGLILMVGGTFTNTGNFQIRNATSTRPARFWQHGGLFVTTDTNTVTQVPIGAGDTGYSVIGGTNIIGGIIFGTNGAASTNTGISYFTNAANIYIGATGITSNGVGPVNASLNSGGLFGATADWTNNVAMALSSGTFTFQAADVGGTAHNIYANGALRGAGNLLKTGGGLLSLGAANTYLGSTIIANGTLALDVNGALTSPQIIVGSGTTFDVSAVSGGYSLASTRVLSGFGTVTGAVALASGGIINAGSNTVTGTLTLANSLTQTGGGITHFDLALTGPGANNDFISVLGDLNATGVNTIEISGGGGPGSIHPLITYGGTFNGGLSNFVISGGSGALIHNAGTKTISFQVATVIRSATNVVWKAASPLNSDWDVVNKTNWLNNTLQNYFVNGDTVTFNATGIASSNVNVVGNVSPATVTVDTTGKYSFTGNGAIGGLGTTILKTNAGTLAIATTNTFTGAVTVAGGALEVSQLASGGVASSIGASSSSAANLILSSAALRYVGDTVSVDRGVTLTSNGTIDVTNAATTLTFGGQFVGGQLIKTGAGILSLGTANAHTGGTVVNAGTVIFGNATAPGPVAAGITNNGATFRVNGAIVIDHVLEFNGNCNVEFSGVAAGNVVLRGSWFGSGNVLVNFLTQNATQTFTIGGAGQGGGNLANFSGTVDFGTNSGSLRLNNDNATSNFGSALATFNLGTGTGTMLHRNGGTYVYLGALFGGASTKLSGRGNGTAGTVTYEIGGKGIDCNFDGAIVDGGGATAIVKVGTNKLTLSGVCTHTGATTVNAGTLEVNGSLASGANLNAGLLTGNGALGGTVNLYSGATFTPGGNAIGQFSMSGTLAMAAGSTNIFQLNKAGATNDSVIALNTLTCGGSLVITNLGGALANGDVFPLFKFAGATNITGTFDQIILPAPPAGISWNTNEIYLSGQLVLGTAAVAAPKFNSTSLTGNQLVFSGTNGSANGNYYVVTHTNVAAPATNWVSIATNVFAPDGSFNFTNTLNPNAPQKYFRIQLP